MINLLSLFQPVYLFYVPKLRSCNTFQKQVFQKIVISFIISSCHLCFPGFQGKDKIIVNNHQRISGKMSVCQKHYTPRFINTTNCLQCVPFLTLDSNCTALYASASILLPPEFCQERFLIIIYVLQFFCKCTAMENFESWRKKFFVIFLTNF